MNQLSALSDAQLAVHLREGSEQAYIAIYNKYKAPLFVHAYHKLHNKEEARDIVQELFAHLWKKRLEVNIDNHLSAYLFTSIRHRILRNIARKDLDSRMLQSLAHFPLSCTSSKTDDLIRSRLLQEIIDKEIDALPQKRKEIFILSRLEGLSHQEIAEKLNLSESTVKKQINNALKIIRKNPNFYRSIILYFFIKTLL